MWCVYLGGADSLCVFMFMCLCVVCGVLRDVVWFVLCVCFECARVCDYVFVCVDCELLCDVV